MWCRDFKKLRLGGGRLVGKRLLTKEIDYTRGRVFKHSSAGFVFRGVFFGGGFIFGGRGLHILRGWFIFVGGAYVRGGGGVSSPFAGGLPLEESSVPRNTLTPTSLLGSARTSVKSTAHRDCSAGRFGWGAYRHTA